MTTIKIKSWIVLVCVVGSAHATGPTPDQQSSKCRHLNQGRSLDGVTQGHNAPIRTIRRGDTHIVRPPRSRPGQGCHRVSARSGDPCTTGMPRLRRQRAPRPRVQQVRRNRCLRREQDDCGGSPASKGAWDVIIIGGQRRGTGLD